MNAFKRLLLHPKLLTRTLTLFLSGIAVLLVVAILSYLFLPESIFKNINPLQNWDVSPRFWTSVAQFFFYNLVSVVLIIASNLISRCSKGSSVYLPYGYLVLFVLFIYYGLIVGTWSFSEAGASIPLIDRLLRIFDLVHRAGLWEMLGRCCVAAATAQIAVLKVRGKEVQTTKVRDIRLSRVEVSLMAFGVLLIFVGALIESNSIMYGL